MGPQAATASAGPDAGPRSGEARPQAERRPSELAGYVDAISGRRVFGWAWDRANPDARIELQVYAGGRLLGAVTAARERPDLRENGIGDGRHAFEFELPEALGEAAAIEVRATRPDTRESVTLGPPENGPGRDRAATARPGSPPRAAIDRLAASQQLLRRDLRSVLSAVERLAGPAGEQETGRDELARRLQNLEVHLVRLDTALRELNGNLAGRDARRPERALLLAIAGVGAISALGLAVGLIGLFV